MHLLYCILEWFLASVHRSFLLNGQTVLNDIILYALGHFKVSDPLLTHSKSTGLIS